MPFVFFGFCLAYKLHLTQVKQLTGGGHMNDKANILIVDDEEVVRLSHLRSLEGSDCNTRAAEDGRQAIQVMEQDPADVILLDLRMPGLDGMDVLKTIKQRWPESEVVVITGYPCIETAKEAVRLGAFNYLTKPLDPDEVMKAANDAITQKRWALRSDRDDQHNKTEFTTH
jgi:DNA-binding NtrC family response regulator